MDIIQFIRMSIQMNFNKDGNNIKLESITDNGNTLDIAAYKDKDLLTIGKDGKYENITWKHVGEQENQSTQGGQLNNTDSLALEAIKNGPGKVYNMGGERKNKTKRMRAGKKSKRVRFMSRRNRRR